MKRGIGYIRVSTGRQVKEGLSLDQQTQKIKDYCTINNIFLTAIYNDEGVSGKSTKRAGYRKLIAAVENSETDVVICYSMSRLCRNFRDYIKTTDFFKKHKVEYVFIKENIDPSTAQGRLVENIMQVIMEFEREQISERRRESCAYRKENGLQYAPASPLGIDFKKGKQVANNKERKVVELAKDWKEKGLDNGQIANELNKKGYTTRKGTHFDRHNIFSLLKATSV